MNQNKKAALLDSSALFGLFFEHDRFHTPAKKQISELTETTILFTVFEEVVALVHHRRTPKDARKISNILLENITITHTSLTNQHVQEINELWQTLPDKIDFVDASLLWAQKKYNLPIITFDAHLNSLQKKLESPTSSTD